MQRAICIQDRIRDVGGRLCRDKGFLFPAFNDRSTDIHGVLYYTKKSEDLQPELIEQLLGARMPMSANTQKETFQMLIEDTLGEDGDYETIRNIHDTFEIHDLGTKRKNRNRCSWIRPMYARYLKRAAFLRKNGVF